MFGPVAACIHGMSLSKTIELGLIIAIGSANVAVLRLQVPDFLGRFMA